MKIRNILPLIIVFTSAQISFAISTMVGDVSMRSAKVWFVGNDNSAITAVCSPKDAPEKKSVGILERVPTPSNYNTGVVVFDNLDAGTEYSYVLTKKDSTDVWGGNFKTRPDFEDRTPPPDFSFVVVGANHINDAKYDPPFRTPGGKYEIFESVRKTNPEFIVWSGGANNLRKADIDSKGAIVSRAIDIRKMEETQKIWSSQANYGVVAASALAGENKDSFTSNVADSKSAFDMTWANPKSPIAEANVYSIKYSDVEIFVLDDFFNRANLNYKSDKPRYLGDSQLKWIMHALDSSKAKFKIIVMNTPLANPVKSPENFTNAAEEKKIFMNFLTDKKISGLTIIAGNKPYGEVTRTVRAGAYPLYEFSPSPLTARPSDEIKEMNYFRVPSSSITTRSFLQVKIDGTENKRAITFTYFDSKGQQLFSTTIKEEELRVFD